MSGFKNDWLRHELRKRGIRQQDIATAWGVTTPALNRWLKAGKNLPMHRAKILCEKLDISMSELETRMANQASPGAIRTEPAAGIQMFRLSDNTFRVTLDLVLPEHRAIPLIELMASMATLPDTQKQQV